MPSKSTKKTVKSISLPQPALISVSRFKRSKISWALIAIALIAILYYFRSLFIVAVINGQPITSIAFIQELEKQGGTQVLDSLVTKTLIYQEAQKQHVYVANNQVAQEISKIDKQLTSQGQKIDQVLATRGMTQKDLEDQLRLQKTIEKLVGSSITISDKEINDYIEKNKDSMLQTQNPETVKTNVREQLKQQKLSEAFQAWLANLQKKAHIQYLINHNKNF